MDRPRPAARETTAGHGAFAGWVLAPANPWKLAGVLVFPLIVILAVLVGMLVGWQERGLEEIQELGLREVGRTFFEHLKATRIWIGGHGGLYVEVPPGHGPDGDGIPDVNDITILGKTYRRVGGDRIMSDVARLLQRRDLYSFRVTSLKPTSPLSRPDPWEAKALESFIAGKQSEATAIVTRGEQKFFRYIAPLALEESCMGCHLRSRLPEGTVRGGLSVEMPMSASDNEYARQVKASAIKFGALGAVAVVVVIIITVFLSFRISEGFLQKLRQESALRNLNELLSEISVRDKKMLENVQDGIAVIDPRGVIEMANRFLLAFDGLAEAQVIGRRIDDLPRDSIIFRILTEGETGDAEGTRAGEGILCAEGARGEEDEGDGGRCWTRIAPGERIDRKCRDCPRYRKNIGALEEPRELRIQERVYTVSSVFVFDERTGEFYCELRVLHDATREKLSAVLELAGAAAHNFRQPLSVIMNLRELISRRIEDGEDPEKELAMLERQCIRLDDIIKKMLRITTYRQKEYLGDLKIVDLETGEPEGDSSGGA